ncbi:nickel-binding protein Mua [Helicobacter sp. 23-1045]
MMGNQKFDGVFERFIQNVENIRESWQIVEFFENEMQKFKDELNDYEFNISKEQNALKDLRSEYLALQEEIKSAKDELELLKDRSEKIRESVPDSIDNLRKNLPLTPLAKVDIRLKDGIVVKANPADDVYSREIAEKYLQCLWELKSIKAQLVDSDLENTKLRKEIRDLKDKSAK